MYLYGGYGLDPSLVCSYTTLLKSFFTFSSTTHVDGGRWDEVFEANVGLVYFTRFYNRKLRNWNFAHLKEAHIGSQTIHKGSDHFSRSDQLGAN